jgi:hypothetical protein
MSISMENHLLTVLFMCISDGRGVYMTPWEVEASRSFQQNVNILFLYPLGLVLGSTQQFKEYIHRDLGIFLVMFGYGPIDVGIPPVKQGYRCTVRIMHSTAGKKQPIMLVYTQ